jgi:transcription-repair coupling factor (superfamily II helicase)
MSEHTITYLPLPHHPGAKIHWGNLEASSQALVLAQHARTLKQPLLIITPDTLTCSTLYEEMSFFLEKNKEILVFPDRETLPYDLFSPPADIISTRLAVLNSLMTKPVSIILASVRTLMHYLPPQLFLTQFSLMLAIGDILNVEQFRHQLTSSGYRHVSQVMEHGDFSIRGAIIDLFPMGSKNPYRIDLLDNEIDSIRIFDPETQLTVESIQQIHSLPGNEFPLDDTSITKFRQNWRLKFEGNPSNSPIYEAISEGRTIQGIEYYQPLFFDQLSNFFQYIPQNTIIATVGDIQKNATEFWQEINDRYQQKNIDRTRPLLSPEELFIKTDDLLATLRQFPQIRLHTEFLAESGGKFNFQCAKLPDIRINRKANIPLIKLQDFMADNPYKILFCTESSGRREILLELLKSIGVAPKTIHAWHEFIEQSEHAICIAPLLNGFILKESKLIVITETEIFGEAIIIQRRDEKTRYQDPYTIIRDLSELSIGSPVVHLQHGVGRYMGLQNLTIQEEPTEFLIIQYADNDKLYVPVSDLHYISRYIGSDSEHVHLNKLGSGQWDKAKRKAVEKIRDVAAEMLALYATRANKKGIPFQMPEEEYAEFCAEFPFETTLDQEKAIQDILKDLLAEKIMDRLVCGDVGFGKTEVAMRAAFIATQNNKQVAVLVPTTLLAQQHYQNFSDRFAQSPQKIEVISRFKTPKEHQTILQNLADGKIDIIIGTHKLLQKNIKFKDLGLLIIDEEHRFGVKQKDRIMELRAEVDLLTLTATPIPRTLNMAMSGMRDLSIIGTPPAKRLAIKTFVLERNKEIVREAILREIMRGGQVFYLHNDVASIQQAANEIKKLVPEINLAVAHGQMHEKELEKIMVDFSHHRFNLLVCTTIIESGIDIPTVNTIIIDRADKFGLSQLHQLRGRVGRSSHQAYAYLLIPSTKLLSKDAEKRLDAITSLEDLGAGFVLATHDLEIRGAGELLGEEQSGQIHTIGFSLYMELLEEAIQTLKKGGEFNLDSIEKNLVSVELCIPALIPENYIPDVHLRLVLYKRIANAKDEKELEKLQVEMIDRFGLLPQPTKNLFNITELKLLAQTLGIHKIEANTKNGIIEFAAKHQLNPDKIIRLIQSKPKAFKLAGENRLRFYILDDIKVEQLPDKIKEMIRNDLI